MSDTSTLRINEWNEENGETIILLEVLPTTELTLNPTELLTMLQVEVGRFDADEYPVLAQITSVEEESLTALPSLSPTSGPLEESPTELPTEGTVLIGSFDGNRTIPSCTVSTGSNTLDYRTRLLATGMRFAKPTFELTPEYLAGIHVFYMFIFQFGSPGLSGAEQTALEVWVKEQGGVLILGGTFVLRSIAETQNTFLKPFGLSLIESFDLHDPIGVGSHPLTRNAERLSHSSGAAIVIEDNDQAQVVFEYPESGEPAVVVIENIPPGGGSIMVLGDLKVGWIMIDLNDNEQFVSNTATWAKEMAESTTETPTEPLTESQTNSSLSVPTEVSTEAPSEKAVTCCEGPGLCENIRTLSVCVSKRQCNWNVDCGGCCEGRELCQNIQQDRVCNARDECAWLYDVNTMPSSKVRFEIVGGIFSGLI